MDTIRNLAWSGNVAGRREMDLPYTCRVPRTYPQVGDTGGGAARATVPVLPICRCPTVTGSAITLQVRRHDKVSEPDTRMGSRLLNQAVPPIGCAGRCGRLNESVGQAFPQRLGNPVAAEATAGILRGTSRSAGRRRPAGHPSTARVCIPIAAHRD